MSESEDDIVEVYSARDVTEAHFVRDLLAAEQIEARVVGEALTTGAGVLPPGEDTAPRVWVHRRDEPRALAVVEEFERRNSAPRGDDDTPAATWKCPTCGEEVDAEFDLCWNCQTPRRPY